MESPAELCLHRERSQHQLIELWRDADGGLELTLDRVWQFRSSEEARFHAFLADAAAVLAPELSRALILGGGDGLAARNLLRYPHIETVRLVELDAAVLELCRAQADCRRLNAGALDDPRVDAIVADALAFVETAEARIDGPYDLIICDFPAPTHPELEPLFAPEFYAKLLTLAHAETLVSVQASCPPAYFAAVQAALAETFAWSSPLLVQLDPESPADQSEAWANFVLACATPPKLRRESRAPGEPFDAARLEAHRIQETFPSHFVSARYGDLPRFDDEDG